MNAMILAAGRGTRLGELGRTVPKVLVELGGEPLLARQIRYLEDGGVKRIVVNTHHLADQIQSFAAGHRGRVDITVLHERELLGTAGGVCNALPYLGREPFVVLYGDVIIDEPIAAVMETHLRAQASATLTVYKTRKVDGKGTVRIAADGMIDAFHEKATSHADGDAYVNAGLYVIDPSLLHECAAGLPLDFGHDVFPEALARDRRLVAHILAEPVIDMGTPAMLELARDELL
jgi:mannose-1-phosphate guanylyltransferase